MQFIWDTVPNSDDPRNPLRCQGGGGFSATAIIACDPNAAVESMSIDSVSRISCNFNIKMRSEAACKPKPFVPIPIANNDEPWGWFSIFCFALFIGFLLYFALGTVYMYRQKGYAEIPHKSFWERSFSVANHVACQLWVDRAMVVGRQHIMNLEHPTIFQQYE